MVVCKVQVLVAGESSVSEVWEQKVLGVVLDFEMVVQLQAPHSLAD